MKKKNVIVAVVTIIIIAILFLIFQNSLYSKSASVATNNSSQVDSVERSKKVVSVNDKPTIVTTKPDPLEETIIS
ncbi:hypothetical protein KKE78_02110, partial [Patescibacteria group bacterium]|nr:hypothetical protein [Patescibacteria group bacterium]